MNSNAKTRTRAICWSEKQNPSSRLPRMTFDQGRRHSHGVGDDGGGGGGGHHSASLE